MCNNLLLSRLFGKIRTREKTKPTSFLREYTSSAFCHIIRLSLKQSYMTKTNVPLYSVRRQQLRDRIPVGIHLNVIRGTWPRIKKSQITCDHKSHVITNHNHKIPNRDLGLTGTVVFLMVVRGTWPRINKSQCSFCWVKVYVYNKCSYSYFWVDFTFLSVLIVFTAITRISRFAYTCSIH